MDLIVGLCVKMEAFFTSVGERRSGDLISLLSEMDLGKVKSTFFFSLPKVRSKEVALDFTPSLLPEVVFLICEGIEQLLHIFLTEPVELDRIKQHRSGSEEILVLL